MQYLGDDRSVGSRERSRPHSASRCRRHRVWAPVSLACSDRVNSILSDQILLVRRQNILISRPRAPKLRHNNSKSMFTYTQLLLFIWIWCLMYVSPRVTCLMSNPIQVNPAYLLLVKTTRTSWQAYILVTGTFHGLTAWSICGFILCQTNAWK